MATTTPNFGWTVPTSSDLVKDGAVAIETLGDAIDASMVDLKGGTTGQVLSKATGTDMDFSWITPSTGGGITLLSTTNLSGTSTTVSSISQAYTNLLIFIENISSNAVCAPALQYNGVTTGYAGANLRAGATTIAAGSTSGIDIAVSQTLSSTNTNGFIQYSINNYTASGVYKVVTGSSTYFISGASEYYTTNVFGANGNTSAITSITLVANGGSFDAGTIKIYGVK